MEASRNQRQWCSTYLPEIEQFGTASFGFRRDGTSFSFSLKLSAAEIYVQYQLTEDPAGRDYTPAFLSVHEHLSTGTPKTFDLSGEIVTSDERQAFKLAQILRARFLEIDRVESSAISAIFRDLDPKRVKYAENFSFSIHSCHTSAQGRGMEVTFSIKVPLPSFAKYVASANTSISVTSKEREMLTVINRIEPIKAPTSIIDYSSRVRFSEVPAQHGRWSFLRTEHLVQDGRWQKDLGLVSPDQELGIFFRCLQHQVNRGQIRLNDLTTKGQLVAMLQSLRDTQDTAGIENFKAAKSECRKVITYLLQEPSVSRGSIEINDLVMHASPIDAQIMVLKIFRLTEKRYLEEKAEGGAPITITLDTINDSTSKTIQKSGASAELLFTGAELPGGGEGVLVIRARYSDFCDKIQVQRRKHVLSQEPFNQIRSTLARDELTYLNGEVCFRQTILSPEVAAMIDAFVQAGHHNSPPIAHCKHEGAPAIEFSLPKITRVPHTAEAAFKKLIETYEGLSTEDLAILGARSDL